MASKLAASRPVVRASRVPASGRMRSISRSTPASGRATICHLFPRAYAKSAAWCMVGTLALAAPSRWKVALLVFVGSKRLFQVQLR